MWGRKVFLFSGVCAVVRVAIEDGSWRHSFLSPATLPWAKEDPSCSAQDQIAFFASLPLGWFSHCTASPRLRPPVGHVRRGRVDCDAQGHRAGGPAGAAPWSGHRSLFRRPSRPLVEPAHLTFTSSIKPKGAGVILCLTSYCRCRTYFGANAPTVSGRIRIACESRFDQGLK